MAEVVLALLGLGFAVGLTLIAVAFYGNGDRATPTFRAIPSVSVWWSGRPRRGFRIRWLIAVAAGVGVWLATGWPVAGIATAGLVAFLPWLFAAGNIAAQHIERLEALEDWLRRLADVLGPGNLGLVGAIQSSARDVAPVLASDVATLAHRLRTWDIDGALLAFADDLDDQIGDAAAAGLCVAHQQGSGVADLLKTLAAQIAENVTARRTAEAERARRRSTARILLGMWAVMFLGFSAFGSATYASAYNTPVGQAVLAVVLSMVAAAAIWLRRLGIEPRGPRFLSDQGAPR